MAKATRLPQVVVKPAVRVARPDTTLSHLQSQVLQCVKYYVGTDLEHNGDALRKFISRGIDDPATILDAHVSDCGLFAFAVWHAVGVDHPLLSTPYHVGMAITWLVEIARVFQAVRHPKHDGVPTVGSLLHYYRTNPDGTSKNDDHVEFVLSNPILGKGWLAEHAGGGRADCGIGDATSDILWSLGRPLQAWYDITAFKSV